MIEQRNPVISVIVPVYKDWDKVTDLLLCLKTQSLPHISWELILVDNGSGFIPDLEPMSINYSVSVCETPGSYAARNHGLKLARGRLIVFTDADCQPTADWLKNLLRASQSNGDNALIAGAIEVAKLDEGSPNSVELYDMALGLPQQRYVSRGYAITANLLVPKAVIERVGAFNDKRFSGGDAEFTQRAVGAGCSLVYQEDAVVMHPARSEWLELARKVKRVKGGQLLHGAASRRAKFLVRTFFPPVFAISNVVRNARFSRSDKQRIIVLLMRLWGVELREVLRLLIGGAPERR